MWAALRRSQTRLPVEAKKLLDQPIGIRESDQMAARNYLDVCFEAGAGDAPLKFQREKSITRRGNDRYGAPLVGQSVPRAAW
jgi:hypothetical protein